MAEPKGYDPVLSSKAAAFLVGLPKRRQRAVVDLLSQLSRTPNQIGDYSEFDEVGRSVQFIVIGDLVIAFWADHAVKEFRIVEIDEI